MLLAAEPLVAAPEIAPSLWGAALRLGLAVGLLVAGAIAWLYWQRRVRGVTRNLEVLERAFVARGASVALLRVGERRLLIGVSTEGVRLLAEESGVKSRFDPLDGSKRDLTPLGTPDRSEVRR